MLCSHARHAAASSDWQISFRSRNAVYKYYCVLSTSQRCNVRSAAWSYVSTCCASFSSLVITTRCGSCYVFRQLRTLSLLSPRRSHNMPSIQSTYRLTEQATEALQTQRMCSERQARSLRIAQLRCPQSQIEVRLYGYGAHVITKYVLPHLPV